MVFSKGTLASFVTGFLWATRRALCMLNSSALSRWLAQKKGHSGVGCAYEGREP